MADAWHIKDGLSGWEIERHNGDRQIIKALEEGWEPFSVTTALGRMGDREAYIYFKRFKKVEPPKNF